MQEVERDDYGFDSEGVHINGTPYDDNGFDVDGDHTNGTVFHPTTHRTRDGERYDEEGYDWRGRNCGGYDRDGYDSDGYDCNNEDAYGNTRCENGDCLDEYCDCQRSGFEGCLDCYSTDVVETCGWKPRSPTDRTLYAGNEIEMYSDDESEDDLDYVRQQIDTLYLACKPQTVRRRATVCTSDGSLDHKPGGFELKIVPLTQRQMYHIFSNIEIVGSKRCSAWTCGLEVGHHIHLSRNALTELTIGKMGVFLNDPFNRPFLEHIAGRGPTYNHYESGKTIKHRLGGHSNVFNTANVRTVELRMFRSNLRGSGILKNYDFAIATVAFCQHVDIRRSSTDWQHFLRWLAKNHAAYPYLHEFLKRPSYVADIYLPLLPKNARRSGKITTDLDAA